MIHDLKTWPKHFRRVFETQKTFEVRKNDRDFQINDILNLVEFDPETNEYSGRKLSVGVTYILHGGEFGIEEGYCVMSIKPVSY